MNEIRLTDEQLELGLRRNLPSEAQADLRAGILAEIESTRQERLLPAPFDRLTDADPVPRRRAILLAAAAMLGIALAAAGVAGALLPDQPTDPIEDLSLRPPSDLAAFARSTYEEMPKLPPLTMTALENGTRKTRIYVDGSGAIRIESFASPESADPDGYKILAGTRMGQLMVVGSERVWYEQTGAISEDPRVFVYAEMGRANFLGGPSPGCETAVSPGETYVGIPGRGWRYVGLEYVAGRPTHRISCVGELWIDVDTRVTLRSRGAVLDDEGRPIPGASRTVEATEIVFGQPPAELFEIAKPAGVKQIDEAAFYCALDPSCSASPRPVVMPPAAPGDVDPPEDVDALVAAALVAADDMPAYDIVVEHWNARHPGSTTRVFHDGSGRYRTETTFDGAFDGPSIVLDGPDYRYMTETTTDGFVFWRDSSSGRPDRRRVSYPLHLPDQCAGGWQVIGVDMVGGRVADHLACDNVLAPDQYWVDRETRLVLRTQTLYDEAYGTDVEEVVDLRFVEPPAALFELPPDADVRP